MVTRFNEFINNIIVENLHPELQHIVTSAGSNVSKQSQIANKIKDLSARGESTGIEGNMPKGSSRAYLQHKDLKPVIVDGKNVPMKTGTKVAIRAALDKYHDRSKHEGMSLGALQNHAEGSDHWVNNNYRTLTETKSGHFETNTDRGIFPPLVEHDHENHEWTHVGHASDIKSNDWKRLTKNKDFPNGITHNDFYTTLNRFHERNNGKHWTRDKRSEDYMDKVEEHPLVQKFIDYHGNTGNPTYDYTQQKNLGVWKHPVTGDEHIVARDHGFDLGVQTAYTNARRKESGYHYST